MKILYKKILNLELWHDFYLGQPDPPGVLPANYDISRTLELVPTQECRRLLANLRWVFRPQLYGASIFANVNVAASGEFFTVVPVDRPYRLTFWLVVRDRYFANFTNLPLTGNRQQIYYFSNLFDNQGHALFLTRPLSAYTANTEYQVGELVTQAGRTLEAFIYQANASDSPNPNEWDTFPATEYVSQRDRLPIQKTYRTQVIANANPGETYRFTLIDSNEQESWAVDETVPDTHNLGEPFSVSISFAGQRPGHYQLLENNTQVAEFVLVDNSVPEACALVEILLNSNLVPSNFSLLQSSAGKTFIQPKTYIIRFKNRATRWRYRYERPHGCNAENLPNDFNLIDARTYATIRPIGLRQRSDSLLNDCKDRPLPSPNAALIQPETDESQRVTSIFSDIYL
ncbi:hypothetical protein F7734_37800 [Scytonema sp. UIC 10036]|uniref:hypothetical protein n=1 Tax=Scytonema sp. UIC 10036 TaxID=2304196 RepID=UPI0012DA9DD9|nr:hypothetical protein [Scytonema sp. UIC 10036]MUG97757.1 hypothetical protein [Scytonema sp. UIC 10036]